jgi:predicted dehydrogenase
VYPFGVIGVGSLGYHHARILRDVAGVEMLGVFDADPARCAKVAEELSVKAYGSCGVAGIGRGRAGHRRTHDAPCGGRALALDRGAHILVEKPIASTLEEADAILARADARGLMVATGHVERFNAALRACEPYLDEPRFIESHRLAPFNPRGTDVAVVLDLMIHDIDLVLGLVKHPVAQVDAVGVPVLTPSVDIANARLRFDSGAVANITASRVSRERMRKIRIFQRSGYISLDLGSGSGEFLRLREGFELGNLAGAPSVESIVERVEFAGDDREPLRAELESFAAAVRGEGEIMVSGHDGRQALAVALEIVQHIEKHVADQRTA